MITEKPGLDKDDIAGWLYRVGLSIIEDENSHGKILMITINDIENGNLVTKWEGLKEIKPSWIYGGLHY
jgi:hypothetical protein